MTNKARFELPRGNSHVKIRQLESKPVSHQSMKVTTSDFDEVRLKLRQIGNGKQRIAVTTPLLGRHKIVMKRNKKNG